MLVVEESITLMKNDLLSMFNKKKTVIFKVAFCSNFCVVYDNDYIRCENVSDFEHVEEAITLVLVNVNANLLFLTFIKLFEK